MFDILTAILYGDDLDLLGKRPLTPPLTTVERQFLNHLQGLDQETANRLRKDAVMLAWQRHDDAFHRGVCFGAQLMAQLMDDF